MSWKNVQYKDGKMRTSEGGGGGGSSTFSGLEDVSFENLQNGQVPKYNSITQKWENKSNSVSRLSDVSLNSPSDGDILRYDAQNDVWENSLFPDEYRVYSTTEKIVGEWIDGRSIYEKTYDLGSDTSISYNSWTVVNATYPSNMDLIIHVDATTSGGTYASGISTGKNTSSGKFEMQTGRNGNNNQAVRYFTVQYTKTTD